MTAIPRSPVYLFYGTQVDEIMNARDQVVHEILPDGGERAENLIEFTPPGNIYGVSLAEILPELDSQMSAVSFIPGAAKVAVIHNPTELYGSEEKGAAGRPPRPSKKSAKGADASAKAPRPPAYLRWFEKALAGSGNHVILLAFEDESAGREVNDKHPLFEIMGKIHGYPFRFRERIKLFFRIEDGLVQRDFSGCLTAVRELWKPGKGDTKVYNAVVRALRFMLQANIGRDRRIGGDPEKMRLLFPTNPSLSLFKANPFVQQKYTARPLPFRTSDMLIAYERLLEVQRALRPRPGDVYVADALPLLEHILAGLFASPPPARG